MKAFAFLIVFIFMSSLGYANSCAKWLPLPAFDGLAIIVPLYDRSITEPDLDCDGIVDTVDPDIDGDGVLNNKDAFPRNSEESVDTDGDGVGNNADRDDDNDGYSDVKEIASGSDPLDAKDVPEPNHTPIPKTGQVESYADFDDGDYQKGASVGSRFVRDNVKKTVKDNATGLVWQDDAEVKTVKRNWKKASEHCKALKLGNFTDWRLPTREELFYITDKGEVNPAINPEFKNVSSSSDYLSSTSNVQKPDRVWAVRFNYGYDYCMFSKKSAGYVRCVRGGLLMANFVRNDALEVVNDTTTGLMWQDNKASKTVTKKWKEAIDYCEKMNFAGYNDWRLPNYNELYSIGDSKKVNPAIKGAFKNIKPSYYWSSTTNTSSIGLAWSVHFIKGNSHFKVAKTSAKNVRCVRGGE